MKGLLLDLLTGRGPLVPLLALVLAGALVFLIAARLARLADAIAGATMHGRLWIGAVLLAGATSLPEVLTAVDAALLDAPDIGVGDLFGAVLVNMLILASLDLGFGGRRILHSVATTHARLGALGILLVAMAGIALVTGGWGRIGHVGIETLAIATVYVAVMRGLYRSMASAPARALRPDAEEAARAEPKRALLGFALAAPGLALVAPLLVLSAQAFALESGVTQTFVGTLLVGLTTTLPEAAATVSAVRLGALDLAVGNLFGSNAFNMTIMLVMDAVYLRGPLLAAVSHDHLLTVLVGIACIGLAVQAILSREEPRPWLPRVESGLIVAAYALAAWALYRLGA